VAVIRAALDSTPVRVRSVALVPTASRNASAEEALRALGAERSRLAVALTLATVAVYFGFIALVAFGRSVLATQLVPGLSVGILCGAMVIVVSWSFTWVYVRWANKRYDGALHRLREDLS
jgi:uncharacterized membrane protein (DUF485 family)